MSDTPIAERLAAELGMPWPLSWMHVHGTLFDYFEPAAGSETGVLADPQRDAAPHRTPGAASDSTWKEPSMAKPTPEELAQLRDAVAWKQREGQDTTGLENIHRVGEQQAAAQDSDKT